MLFWIVCALLTTLAVILVLRPMASGPRGAELGAAAADLDVYRDQLAEIDRDLERGLIHSTEAEAARIEISRRLLNADAAHSSNSGTVTTAEAPRTAWTAYTAAAFIVLTSLVGYMGLGSPGLPGTNHAERARQDPRKASVREQIARVEARLRENPEDAVGWEVIAPVYLKLRRYRDAVGAFQQVIKLKGPTVRRLMGLGEALLALTNGRVTTEVRQTYAKILELKPGDRTARFWLAMGHEQAGEKDKAVEGFRALLVDAQGNTRFQALLRERLAALGVAVPPSNETPSPPDTQAGRTIAALPPKERLEAIRGMVAGLAARLAQKGDDVAGWKRLMQAYVVLGERDKAVRAYADGRKALAGNAAALGEIDALARRLGIGS
ncbi:MAG: c-type cytochrome biogenesis protein CcmI [Hyphomicrobiaceae bacterium]|nr:c-type cytochrome biogenesis protein CcmI [Hyphomicrobiaceae bacterium]